MPRQMTMEGTVTECPEAESCKCDNMAAQDTNRMMGRVRDCCRSAYHYAEIVDDERTFWREACTKWKNLAKQHMEERDYLKAVDEIMASDLLQLTKDGVCPLCGKRCDE